MAGLLNWNAQDTLKREEHDGVASEMTKEGNIRRWERYSPTILSFFLQQLSYKGRGLIAMFLFLLPGVIRLFYHVSLVLHSPVALSTEPFLSYTCTSEPLLVLYPF